MIKKQKRSRWIAGTVAMLLAVSLVTPTLGARAQESETVDLNRFTAGDPVDIFEAVPNGSDHTHGSGIAVLPNGELLCVWFQGNGERDGTTTRIMGSRLPVGEDEWTEPFVMADAPGIADINPAVYLDSQNRLWMFWYPVLSGMWETSQPKFAYAEMGNYEYENVGNQAPEWTWSDIIPIKIGPNIGGVVEKGTESYEFVQDYLDGFAALSDYIYDDVAVPESPEDVYEDGWSIYEDGNTGGGVNAAIEKERRDASQDRVLKRIGGDENEQSFTPTVADKVGPTASGEAPRSGYPLLRRIGWQTKNAPLEVELPYGVEMSNDQLSQGGEMRIIVPLYSDGLGLSINAITDDGGKTWMMSKPLVGLSAIQASMAQRDNGEIVALMRNNGPVPFRAAYAISEDYGMSWSTVQLRSDLMEPGVGNCLTELPDGNWVFVSNGVDNEERGVLSIALSEDEGKTWPFRRTIELDTRDGTDGNYHYPAVTSDEDNNIYITYSIDYGTGDGSLAWLNNIRFLKVDEDWIKEGDWSDEDDTYKAIFCYEYSALDLELPENFNEENVGTDGRYAMAEIEKLAEALPKSIKGYLTYNNHDGEGLYLAAPEYVEIPVTVDKEWLQLNFQVGKTMEDVPFIVDLENLPEGVTEEMLPEFAPSFCKILVQ